MSDQTDYSAEDLLREAQRLPYSPARVVLVERAVRVCDAENLEDMGFLARMALTEAAGMIGWSDRTIVSFTWCLSRFTEEPERYARYELELLWWFKSIAERMIEFSRVSLEQVHEVLDKMEEFYKARGYSLRTVYSRRCYVALRCGGITESERHFQRYRNEPFDVLCDSITTAVDEETEYYVVRGDLEKAITVARPNLDGRNTYGGVPSTKTPLLLMRPLVLLGRTDEALALHHRSYPLVKQRGGNPFYTCAHQALLNHLGRYDEALTLFERHLQSALDMADEETHFRFYQASARTVEAMAAIQPSLYLALPSKFALYDGSGEYDSQALAVWLRQKATELAQEFDIRNGNHFYSTAYGSYYDY